MWLSKVMNLVVYISRIRVVKVLLLVFFLVFELRVGSG